MRVVFLLSLISISLAISSCARFDGPGGYRSQNRGFNKPSYKGSHKYTSPDYTKYVPSGELKFYWPVRKLRVSRGFSKRRSHDGIDIPGRYKEPVLAAHSGVVVYVGQGYRGYGKMILIEYDNTWASLYAHLETILVSTGDIVNAQDKIGLMGSTGRSTGVHLHFELLKNKLPVDPKKYILTYD